MFDLSPSVSRRVGLAIVGVAFAAVPVITALGGGPAQSVAEPACSGSESIVDGTPTCVPAPAAPGVSNVQPAPVDTQQQDGGHH
ncbi:hypothetical protein [Mycobacterium sp. 852002-51961_SCH5331710]|uniref:hypothetical protein n=1 Tax=Mycobacterium sp. 852002-51961_SCH5331710 TaxID=1834105 RepID=UPI0007FC6EB6|nr:hypothetical protein [Mycobacterium sp. 852002-51961_SCH5331710]OBB45603.1 hypothetical protein A5752_01850 [Mycobacterium sp. 852002-51961_SCH5331710]